MEWSYENEAIITYDDAVDPNELRVLFVGPRRSGKTSIERVVFHKMSPHETLFLESTQNVDVNLVANNNFIRFQTWDFGGDLNLMQDILYLGKKISVEKIFKNCTTLIYVLDAQEDDFEDSLPKLVEIISIAHRINPSIHFEVFLHKVDGDTMTEETKAERQQGVQHYISSELSESNGDVLVSYHLTSIYDHSTLEAFSKVVQKLVPELPTLNNLLDSLISSSNVEKSYLVDVKTKLYIATDSSPVDVHTYELCADLVDVVIDVSYIYGVKSIDMNYGAENVDNDAGQGFPSGNGLLEGGQYLLNSNLNMTPYDQSSASAIKLNNDMVLYLREVSEFVALICVLRNEYFEKRAILDHNINSFKNSLKQLIKFSETKSLHKKK